MTNYQLSVSNKLQAIAGDLIEFALKFCCSHVLKHENSLIAHRRLPVNLAKTASELYKEKNMDFYTEINTPVDGRQQMC
jgi:hypothetical protein